LKADDGKLWIGTFGGGLICYDNGRIIHYKKNIPEQEKWLSWLTNIIKRRSHNMVRAVSQDKQGRIWIGTDQDGIDILDKKTGEVRQLRNKAGDERSLQNNTVMVLYEDSSETMWVGTYKKGISYFNNTSVNFYRKIKS
jgi:ligand-binding sensor domain-containing protein